MRTKKIDYSKMSISELKASIRSMITELTRAMQALEGVDEIKREVNSILAPSTVSQPSIESTSYRPYNAPRPSTVSSPALSTDSNLDLFDIGGAVISMLDPTDTAEESSEGFAKPEAVGGGYQGVVDEAQNLKNQIEQRLLNYDNPNQA